MKNTEVLTLSAFVWSGYSHSSIHAHILESTVIDQQKLMWSLCYRLVCARCAMFCVAVLLDCEAIMQLLCV